MAGGNVPDVLLTFHVLQGTERAKLLKRQERKKVTLAHKALIVRCLPWPDSLSLVPALSVSRGTFSRRQDRLAADRRLEI